MSENQRDTPRLDEQQSSDSPVLPVFEPGNEPVPNLDQPRPESSLTLTMFKVLTTVLVLMVVFLGGAWTERHLAASRDEPISDTRFNSVASTLENEYYRGPTSQASASAFDYQLEQSALSGLASGAGDPYTVYLPPADAQPLTDTLNGQYGGIGVTVQLIDGNLVVTQVLPGGPAARAGIAADDVLVTADGVPFAGKDLNDAGNMIRGQVGSTVNLVVYRPSTDQRIPISVTRQQLEAPSVVSTIDPKTRVVHLQVTVFSGVTTSQLDAALDQAKADGATGFILDLRDNGGGSVTAAQEMIGRFISPQVGPGFYETVGRMGESDGLTALPIIGRSDGVVSNLPLVVLVNGNTASAAEIVAASLHDYGRAKIVGVESFGKGSVQRVHTFPDGAVLKVTVAEWLTPDHQKLDHVGVHVDVVVPNDPSIPGVDAQLDAARAFLRTGGASAANFGW